MHIYTAKIIWKRTGEGFLSGKYSREHLWKFDGGAEVPASSSPSVVPLPFSNADCVDPEEAFVASISSCHALTFLYLACRAGFQVDSYVDQAEGVMSKNEKGVLWMSEVTLRPQIVYSGVKIPTEAERGHLHHESHAQCYIANSIKTEVRVIEETIHNH